MQAFRALSRLGFLRNRRAPRFETRRGAHDHHESHNPGPPVTLDYSPVPFQPYHAVHSQLQSKFNLYLAVSSVLLVTSFALAIADDVFIFEALRPPQSYRNRNK
uniref:Deltameth_res domain-containing protein n=1 Tax=Panagrellus redivivus TaxID=6233 RepID=A0A7E4V135_PANRE